MMKCHARYTHCSSVNGRAWTSQASDQVARCSSFSPFLAVLLMRFHRVLHVWPHGKVFCVAPSHRLTQLRVGVCVCARQSPLTCPEASFPNLHGSVIAKFKQWSKGDRSTTPYPQTRQTRWGKGKVQRNQSFAYIAARIRTPSESAKEGGEPGQARQSRQGKTSQRGSPQGGGLMNTSSMYPFADLPANWKQ